MRRGGNIGLGLAACLLFYAATAATAQEKMSAPAEMLFRMANQERTSRGIGALKWDASLADAARHHALRMADQETLSHQLPGEPDVSMREKNAGAKMSAAAENIASGPNVADIHPGWMHSPGHRHNLLNPQYDSVGIAVVQRGELFWAVEDFSRSLEALSLGEQEKIVGKAVRSAGLTVRFENNDARRVCAGMQPLNSQPIFIAKFSSTNLSTLPESLERTLRSGNYLRAEIGACTKPATDGLSDYHIAVLLY